MGMTDPIGDCFAKIRNASLAKHAVVDVRASKLAERVLVLLKEEGFIRNYKRAGEAPKQSFRVYLKYATDKTPAITQLARISKPGRRYYRRTDQMPRVLSGLGRAILTTSKGVMTDQEARRQKIGGEVLCYVW